MEKITLEFLKKLEPTYTAVDIIEFYINKQHSDQFKLILRKRKIDAKRFEYNLYCTCKCLEMDFFDLEDVGLIHNDIVEKAYDYFEEQRGKALLEKLETYEKESQYCDKCRVIIRGHSCINSNLLCKDCELIYNNQ